MTPAVGKYLTTVHTQRGASFLYSTTEADVISETTLFHHTTQRQTGIFKRLTTESRQMP
jgi:hypothetical protein